MAAGAIYGAGGIEEFFTGINQVIPRPFSRTGWEEELHGDIIRAAHRQNLPPELVASVLMAELLDYNVGDFVMDDLTWYKPEEHSMGIAQFRIDEMRKYHINNWDNQTPAYEIRAALMDPKQAVDILAKTLRYYYDAAIPAAHTIFSFANWDSLTEDQQLQIVRGFAGAKDTGKLNGQGLLAGCADKAFKLVHESGRYGP